MDKYHELEKLIGKENVSRETFSDLEKYIFLLEKWNKSINLVGRSTVENIWHRHILDCAQIIKYIPKNAEKIIDLGCGAGLPGLVISILSPKTDIHLVESDIRKNAFLTEVKSHFSTRKITLHNQRIESLEPINSDVITCRALAPINNLLELSFELIKKSKNCIFFKGQNVVEEIEEANICWGFEYKIHSSSLGNGHIVEIQNVQKRG